MTSPVKKALKQKAQHIARRALTGAAAGLCAIVGLGFLTAAGWQVLASELSAIEASAIVGCVYLVLAGGLLYAIRAVPKLEEEPSSIGTAELVQTFLMAAQAGRSFRR